MRDVETEELAKRVIDSLKKARKDKGLSHETLAAMTGLSRATISFVESGKRNPTLLTALKLAKALGVDMAALIASARISPP